MDLQNRYDRFQAKQTEIVAVAVHTPTDAREVAQVTGATFPLLADPDHVVAEAYGVYDLLGDGLATPAVFIIDQYGQIVWSYVGKDRNDRPNVQTILANLPSS